MSIILGTSQINKNAAAARIYGLDFDFVAKPVNHLTLSGGAGILNTKYKSFLGAPSVSAAGVLTSVDATGRQITNAPKFTANFTAAYVIPSSIGDFRISGTVAHKSKSFATPDHVLVYEEYSKVSALVGWTSTSGKYGIDFWGANLTDQKYHSSLVGQTGFGLLQVSAPPRTYGVRVKANF